MGNFGWIVVAAAAAAFVSACGDSNRTATGGDDSVQVGSSSATSEGALTSATSSRPQDASTAGAQTGSVDTGSTHTGEADEAGVDPPVIFDLGTVPDAPDNDNACRKVDFLFVIDNSGSMFNYQQELVANFPVFIQGIQNSLDSVMSYQVGIVTTDAYNPNVAGCQQLSSLVTRTGGDQSSNMTCGPFAEGYNFMTEQDDLGASFTCAAQVGTTGSALELTMSAVEQAVTRAQGGPGQCNEGFIRDDALLVIIIITDEADGPGDPDGIGGTSPGTPASWFQTVVDAKMGIPENVVVLSLINYAGGACPPFSATDDGQNIADFTTMFGENGFLGGICEADYAPIFTSAIGVIDEACENFVTPS